MEVYDSRPVQLCSYLRGERCYFDVSTKGGKVDFVTRWFLAETQPFDNVSMLTKMLL